MSLQIQKLYFSYPTSHVTLFEDFSLQFYDGWTCVAGSNGCGKSTLLKLIAGLLIPDSGKISGAGIGDTSDNGIIYCPQETAEIPENLYSVFWSDDNEVRRFFSMLHITEEMITSTKEQFEGKDISKAFKQTLDNTKNHITKKEKVMLKGYKILNSNQFRMIILFCIALTIILIAMIQKSFFQWIRTLGIAITISGIILIAFNFILKQIVFSSTNSFIINTDSFLYSSLIIMISGIWITALFIIVSVIISKRKEKKNEIS